MKDKVIIIGASTVGKSTLIEYLRTNTNLQLDEMDTVLTRMNGGVYPKDGEHRHKVLVPRMVQEVLGHENIVFFTNTNAFSTADLEQAHRLGFVIIQLTLTRENMEVRNLERVKHNGYEDVSMYFTYMIKYQELIKNTGIVDKEINADQSVEDVARDLLELIIN